MKVGTPIAVGATSLTGSLFVKADGNGHAIAIEEAGTGNERYTIGVNTVGALTFTNVASNTPTLTIGDNNNVGIGTTAPTKPLQVTGDISASGDIQLKNTKALKIENAAGTSTQVIKVDSGDDIYVGHPNFDNIYVQGSGGTLMTLLGSGNVGIGTTSPNQKLHVAGGLSISQSTAGQIGSLFEAPTQALQTLRFDSQRFRFWAGGSERLTILSASGNVGIGTSSPDYKLDVAGGVGINDYIYHNGDDSKIGFEGNDAIRMYTANSVAIQIDSNQNVGIGTTNPQFELDVQGDIRATGDVVANRYVVSSSVTHLTQSFSDGSTIFGDDISDTHQFNGHITASGNISSSGVISATDLVLNGSGIQITTDSGFEIEGTGTGGFNFASPRQIFLLAGKGRTDNADTLHLGSAGVNSQFVLQGGHITASGNISASGTILASVYKIDDFNAITTNGTELLFGNANNWTQLTYGRQDADAHKFNGHITASGNISGSSTSNITVGGTITAGNNLSLNGTNPSITVQESSTEFFKLDLRVNDFDIGCDDSDDIHFGHYSSVTDTSISTKMTIGADGDVGIGDASPSSKLQIAGDLTVDSHITASSNINIEGATIHTVHQLGDGATTPDVSGKTILKTANSGTTTINGFTGGTTGQIVYVLIQDNNTDFSDGTNLQLYRGFDHTSAQTNDTITFICVDGTKWVEQGRSDNT